MTSSVSASAGALEFAGEAVSVRHLGANFLFNRESFDEGVGAGGFDETTARLGISHLRYPGGTITERQFDPANPDNTFQAVDLITGAPIANTNQHDLTPLSDFLAYTVSAGAQVTIVLPSFRYRDAVLSGDMAEAEAEIRDFVAGVLSGPNGHVVEAFELGNEWYALPFASAAEYGAVADQLAIWTAEGIAQAGTTDPTIAVQAAQRAARPDESGDIAAQLSPEARAEIDAVVIHNYRPYPWLEEETTAGKFDHMEIFEAALGRPLETFVTEWNVGNASDADGLLQGAGILALFDQMLREGMDLGHIWPVLENNTSRLAGDITQPGLPADLHPSGEIYRQMTQSLPGLLSATADPGRDLDSDGADDLLVHVFGDLPGGGTVVFLSSLSAAGLAFSFDLGGASDLQADGAPVWLTRTGVTPGEDPTDPGVFPVVDGVRTALTDGVLDLSLGAYETVRLEFAGAALGLAIIDDGAGLDSLRATEQADVFVLGDDGARDLIRDFNPWQDRLDFSAFGAQGLEDLEVRDLVRRDGSVSWIEIRDSAGEAEAILRFDGDWPLTGALLGAEAFLFAEVPPVPDAVVIADSAELDDIRLSTGAEIVVLSDDVQRDMIRGFDLAEDRLDLTTLQLSGFEDLTLCNLVRRDGSVSWIEVSGPGGDAAFILRFDGTSLLDAALLGPEHFVL